MADNTKSTSKLILAFVTLILGIVLIQVIASTTNSITTLTGVNSEALSIAPSRTGDGTINQSLSNFTVTNYPTSWKVNDCPIVVSRYGNASNAYTLDTDYKVYGSLGRITVLNTTTTVYGGNSTLVSYAYCKDDYLNSTFGRTSVSLIGGFFALALMLISVGLFYSVAKDMEII
jgi:hypothetical protein